MAATPLYEALCVLDAPDAVTPGDVQELLARPPSAPPSEALRALVRDVRRRDDLRCALCAEPACDGHVLRLHFRATAPVEARLELEDLVRAADLALYDPDGPELTRGARLGAPMLLERALSSLAGAGEGYVLVESEHDPAIYVQVLAGGGDAQAEAVSTRHLPHGRALDRSQLARLRLLGWRTPAGERRNHHRPAALGGVEERAALAGLLVRTLREVYGLAEGAPLVMHTHCVPSGGQGDDAGDDPGSGGGRP